MRPGRCAEAITTDTGGLQDRDAKIKVGSEEMPAYFARPAGNTKAPVIIVAMEIFGLHKYIKDVIGASPSSARLRSRPTIISVRASI